MKVVHFHRKKRPNSNYSIEGFYSNIRNELKDKIEIEYIELPFYSNGIIRRILNCIYAAFKQGDVNHITGDVNYLNLLFRKNKNILTIHDCGLLNRLRGIKLFVAKHLWFQIPIARSRYVVAISEATKKEILKYVKCDPDKIKVIHVSVSTLFHRVDKEFNKDKPEILHIGTAPNKNLTGLISAIKGLDCRLAIVGELKEAYQKELNKNNIDYVNFVGISDEEIFEKYKSCDILFFASTYEGFGMPIVEANTIGRPVITSNLLSMPEVAGDAALIVNPYYIYEIRNGIFKIINDDNYRNVLINEGFKNAKRFNLKSIAMQYSELYEAANNK